MAAPVPSHAGSIKRICVHANTQGMARKDSIPPLILRFAGREPSGNICSSSSGVTVRKYFTKCGFSRTV